MALTRITKGVIKPNEDYSTRHINSTGIVTAIGLDINGNGDISGNLSVGGVLTYEDVTSIDSVGVITARDGIHVGAGVSAVGVGTFSGLDISGDIDVDGHTNLDNVSIAGVTTITGALHADGFSTVGGEIAINGTVPRIGFTDSNANSDFRIKVDGGSFQIEDITNSSADRFTINSSGNVSIAKDLDVDGHTNLDNVSIAGVSTFNGESTFGSSINLGGELNFTGNGHKYIDVATLNGSNTLTIRHQDGGSYETAAYFDANGGAFLQFNGNTRFQTTNAGATVHGNLTATTGIDCNGDIDVDGHTNLDNVNVAGVSTFASNVDIDGSTTFGANGSITAGANFVLSSNKLRVSGSDTVGIECQRAGNATIQCTDTSNSTELQLRANSDGGLVRTATQKPLLFGTYQQERLRIGINGQIGIAGQNYGTSGQVLTSGGSGSTVTWSTKLANVVEDTSPQLGGDLYSNGRHIRMDNTKYVWLGTDGFGIAGYSNNQVYFEGNSTGQTLYIRPKLNQESIKAIPNGAVLLHHSGNQKLATESDGVTVNGLMEASRTRNTPITTTERNALGTPDEGTMIYNNTLKKLQVYSDGDWVSFSGKIINTSGGSIDNDGARSGYIVHTFTSPGTFNTDGSLEGVEIMVVGGGGGGGGHRYGSGGGAGGVIMRPGSSPTPAYPLSSPAPVVVGSGGAAGPQNGTGSNGSNSTFGTGPMQLIGKGGGGGTSYDGPVYPGRSGGSGGGGTSRAPSTPGGSATQPGTHGAGSDYGQRGGNYNVPGGGWAPGGGGGAGGHGIDTPGQLSGGANGGSGVQLSISGTATYYAGGGAGGIYNNQSSGSSWYGIGGNGGGGSSWNSVPGSYPGHSQPGHGAANSGGGGCGAHGQNPSSIPINNALSAGKSGGSGIVIVAYPTNQPEGDVNAS